MKPHIYKSAGVWICGVLVDGAELQGVGYTPLMAYADWMILMGSL